MKLKILTLLLFVLSLFSCEVEKPNVIFILTDQWRASALGYTGNEIIQTPRLDQFAEEAVNFRNAVSVTPVCTPYRASLMTGRYPTTTGMFINDLYLPEEELCMAEIFDEAGYNTCYLGKWHLDGHGRKDFIAPERRQGWQHWKAAECDHDYLKEHYYQYSDTLKKFWEGYSPYAISSEAQRYMEQFAEMDKPFLLFVSLATPHFPHKTAPEEYKDIYPLENLNLPPNVPEEKKKKALQELQGYYAHCTANDRTIGEILDKTKSLDIQNNTIIVFTSDHGEMMGSHNYRPFMKHQPYAESANVPFLISYPGIRKNKGKVTRAPITTPDILPSLLSLCNIEIPGTIEGYDLSEIMLHPEKEYNRAALFMNLCPFGIAFPDDEYRAIKTSEYTYVKTPEGASMLFNNITDPYEMENLVNRPAYDDIQKELDDKLIRELSRINEEDVKPREYYLKKFGYYERRQFNKSYHIANYNKVDTVVSPNNIFRNTR